MACALTMGTVATAGLVIWIHKLRDGEWWGLGLTRSNLGTSVWVGFQAGLAIMGLKFLWFKLCQVFNFGQLSGFSVAQGFFLEESPVLGGAVGRIAPSGLFAGFPRIIEMILSFLPANAFATFLSQEMCRELVWEQPQSAGNSPPSRLPKPAG